MRYSMGFGYGSFHFNISFKGQYYPMLPISAAAAAPAAANPPLLMLLGTGS